MNKELHKNNRLNNAVVVSATIGLLTLDFASPYF